ncbi:MAG: hypothetical protein ABDH21_04410 [bacterium]
MKINPNKFIETNYETIGKISKQYLIQNDINLYSTEDIYLKNQYQSIKDKSAVDYIAPITVGSLFGAAATIPLLGIPGALIGMILGGIVGAFFIPNDKSQQGK